MKEHLTRSIIELKNLGKGLFKGKGKWENEGPKVQGERKEGEL
jgi:hypothetical protein